LAFIQKTPRKIYTPSNDDLARIDKIKKVCETSCNMKVIFIAPKANLPQKLIEKIEKLAEVHFFEDDPVDISKIDLLKEKGEKILCPFPEPMAWKFPNEFIKDIPDLKAICLSTTSFNWVDGKLARSLNVHLTNVPNPPNAVAEGAISMMLVVARRYALFIKGETFEFIPENYLLEVKGKTLGIIGLGRIGRRIAELGNALGMNVVYWSKSSRNKKYQYLDLDDLLKKSDFVFPCIALNEETRNFVSRKKIDVMKPTASLILITPNDIVDIDYLITKVANHKLFGCAFQEDEKPLSEFKGNVFTTPRNNWYTKETVDEKMKIWIDNIIGAIKNKPIHLVN